MPTLEKVSLDITVVLGSTVMPVHQVLRLGRGAIIELQASEDDEVQILANNLPVARGTVVVNGNRITQKQLDQELPIVRAGQGASLSDEEATRQALIAAIENELFREVAIQKKIVPTAAAMCRGPLSLVTIKRQRRMIALVVPKLTSSPARLQTRG